MRRGSRIVLQKCNLGFSAPPLLSSPPLPSFPHVILFLPSAQNSKRAAATFPRHLQRSPLTQRAPFHLPAGNGRYFEIRGVFLSDSCSFLHPRYAETPSGKTSSQLIRSLCVQLLLLLQLVAPLRFWSYAGIGRQLQPRSGLILPLPHITA